MDLENLQEYISPVGLIIAGVVMKVAKNKKMFQGVDKYWFYFVLLGVVLMFLKYLNGQL